MRAAIMAGGNGIRLRPYTQVLPKPMLPLGERPILAWLIDRLVRAGVTEIDLAVRHLQYVFASYFGNGERYGTRIRYLRETEPLGSAGSLRRLSDVSEPFLVTNADMVTTLDFAALMRRHVERQAWLTVATQERTSRSPMGIVETEHDRIVAFHEKPARRECISLGVYAVSPRALAYLPPEGACDMPDLIRSLLAAGHPVLQYRTSELWYDLGTVADYEAAVSRWPELEPLIRGMDA
jgi:NDP-sugar pyrophosphorylase family protein